MLGVFFLFSQFSPIEKIVYDKNIIYPIEDIDFLSSNEKKYILPPIIFWKVFTFWTKLCRFYFVGLIMSHFDIVQSL